MNKLVKPIRELDAAARKKLEEVLQTPVTEDQQVVLEPAANLNGAQAVETPSVGLSKKYHVYEGLSEQEVDELEKIILDRDNW